MINLVVQSTIPLDLVEKDMAATMDDISQAVLHYYWPANATGEGYNINDRRMRALNAE